MNIGATTNTSGVPNGNISYMDIDASTGTVMADNVTVNWLPDGNVSSMDTMSTNASGSSLYTLPNVTISNSFMDGSLANATDNWLEHENVSFMEALTGATDTPINITTDAWITTSTAIMFTSTSFTVFHEKVIFWVIGTIGLFGNSLVIFVFLRSPSIRGKITNMLILNQAVIDLISSMFVALNNGFDDISWITKPGPLAYYFCKLWLSKYSIWGSMVVSTFNLVALTLERYLALIHPMIYRRYFTRKGVRVTIFIVWITGLAFMSFVVWSTELKGTVCSTWTEWPSKIFQNVFGVIVIFLEFIIPICFMAVCYGRIAIMIHKETKMVDANPSNREKKLRRARFNVIRTLLLVSICFFLCWVWDSIYFLLYNLGFQISSFTSPIYQFSVVACFANCCINPFIYVFSYRTFQKRLKPAFGCQKKRKTKNTVFQKYMLGRAIQKAENTCTSSPVMSSSNGLSDIDSQETVVTKL